MALVGVKCTRGYIPMEEHYKCMVEMAGPPCLIEPSILERITRPTKERDTSDVVYSPSTISACQRRTVLAGKHDWYMDVKQGYKMVRGSIIHDGMENDPPYPGILGVVREVRMGAPIKTKFGEKEFKGKPDLIVLTHITSVPVLTDYEGDAEMHNTLHVKLVDYKTKGEVGHDLIEPARDNVIQINAYAWIITQFLADYLNGLVECDDCNAHVFLHDNVDLPHIDHVVVDELSLHYMDMTKTRTFSSSGFLYADGKMKGDRVDGRWKRRSPVEHEELELAPIHQFSKRTIEAKIREGIEAQIEAESVLALPMTGDDAKLMCRSCPVRQHCYDTGIKEGLEMEDQKPYVNTNSAT